MSKRYRVKESKLRDAFRLLAGSGMRAEVSQFEKFLEDKDLFFKDLNELEKENFKKYVNHYMDIEEATGVLVYSIYQFIRFMEPISKDSGVFQWIKKSGMKIPKSKRRRLFIFFTILINVSNYLGAIRNLSSHGLNLQSRTLAKSFIEYCDIGVCVLFDRNFFEAYQNSSKSETSHSYFWWNYQRPKAIEKHLKSFISGIDPSGATWELVKYFRTEHYGFFSDHSHGHYLASAVGGFSSEIGQDRYIPSLGGIVTRGTGNSLSVSVIYGLMFLRNIIKGLEGETGVRLYEVNSKGMRLSIIFSICDKFIMKNKGVFK